MTPSPDDYLIENYDLADTATLTHPLEGSMTETTGDTIRTTLSRNQTGHFRINLTIGTTSPTQYAYLHDAIVDLILSTMRNDRDADVEFETANTTRSHFDTQPF